MLKALLIQFIVVLSSLVFFDAAGAQSLPKVHAAYTSIAIQRDAIYIMKEAN